MKVLLKYFLLSTSLVLVILNSFALDTTSFEDAELHARYKTLTHELRCLVCQNETIAESSAPLALDLRVQVAEQLRAGQTNVQIRAYMTERYGEFILYRPQKTGAGQILWIAPLLLLLGAGLIFIVVVSRKGREEPM